MSFVELTLASIEDIDDGRVARAYAHELKRIVQDCMDRPGDKNARTVTLKAKVTPIPSTEAGILEMDGAEVEFMIEGSVPKRKSKTYSLRANKQGQLSYSSNSPENADQTTFMDVDPETGKVDRGKKPSDPKPE
jgi:hypothetical protein